MTDDFIRLDEAGQVAALRALGEVALREFGVVPDAMEPLVHAENTTFRVTAGGRTYCLRIHRPGYRSEVAVRSEMIWLRALRTDLGLEVPEPMPSPDGSGVVRAGHDRVPEVRHCVLFHWLEGEFHKGAAVTEDDMRLLGQTMARMHAHAQGWRPPRSFVRDRLDEPSLEEVGREALTREGRTFLSAEDATYVLRVLEEGRALTQRLGHHPDVYGLIHADLHGGNLLYHEGGLRIIDFDDGGYGHFLWDFAAALAFATSHPEYPALREALLAGYTGVRPLPPATEEALDETVRRRLVSVAHWIATRIDNPWCREEGPAMVENLLARARGIEPERL